MVRDGIYYALGLSAGAAILGWLTGPWGAAPLLLAALFCLWFFRDPDRVIPEGNVAVSPADGKVVSVKAIDGQVRVSIFLNIFDVHVNRSPIGGTITKVDYHAGRFMVASHEEASSANEQNVLTVRGDGTTIVFSQIAGLIARRIVCYKKAGDPVKKGERVGLIKFGSRTDAFFGPEWQVTVRVGQRVSAGSSIIARRLAGGEFETGAELEEALHA